MHTVGYLGIPRKGDLVARKMILVSDLSGKLMESKDDSVRITITFGDTKLPQYVLDAHPEDAEVKQLLA